MTALLDLAKDVISLLDVVITQSQKAHATRIWYFPRIPGLSRFHKDPASPIDAKEGFSEVGESVSNMNESC